MGQIIKMGQITFAPGEDEERIMEIALEKGADDVVINEDKSIDVIVQPEEFLKVKKSMLELGLKPVQADIAMTAKTEVAVSDKETAEKIVRLTDMLEDLDDVQEVFSNADIPEEILAEL